METYPRHISSLIYKIRLNSWKTKYSQNIACACSKPLSGEHILFHCPILNALYSKANIEISKSKPAHAISFSSEIVEVAKIISQSQISIFL
uniref:Conotoxin-like unassigned superfamily 17 n=1 Tax=Conus magus TaxID=6492 RepID=A0A5P8I129_CONMA|nr:hypothetical protein [Conus magus]